MINASRPMISPVKFSKAPSLKTSLKAVLLSRINSNKSGKITGKPSIAIKAAFWLALAAMALIKVNTRLILAPPRTVMPVNKNALVNGLFKKAA